MSNNPSSNEKLESDFTHLKDEVKVLDEDVKGLTSKVDHISGLVEEHSRSSKLHQSAMLVEIAELRKDYLTRTGSHRTSIERIDVERRTSDQALKEKIDYYEKREKESIEKIDKWLEKFSGMLKEINDKSTHGEWAFRIIVWASFIFGGAMLLAFAFFIMSGRMRPVQADQQQNTPELSHGKN